MPSFLALIAHLAIHDWRVTRTDDPKTGAVTATLRHTTTQRAYQGQGPTWEAATVAAIQTATRRGERV